MVGGGKHVGGGRADWTQILIPIWIARTRTALNGIHRAKFELSLLGLRDFLQVSPPPSSRDATPPTSLRLQMVAVDYQECVLYPGP